MQTQICCFPLPWRPSFSVRPENEAKDALKSTYGSLDNHSLLPTHSQYDKHKRIFEPLTPYTCKNTFHSLRQYLDCNFIFDYTSLRLFNFRLYCSLANEVLLEYAIYILLARISQNTNFLLSFLIPNFTFQICLLPMRVDKPPRQWKALNQC